MAFATVVYVFLETYRSKILVKAGLALDGNDIYYFYNLGEVITETNAVSAIGGVDLVRAEISYTLGTNL